ncbi:hypothetical protein CBL_12406 [Carabus blaptoides fortunei]
MYATDGRGGFSEGAFMIADVYFRLLDRCTAPLLFTDVVLQLNERREIIFIAVRNAQLNFGTAGDRTTEHINNSDVRQIEQDKQEEAGRRCALVQKEITTGNSVSMAWHAITRTDGA